MLLKTFPIIKSFRLPDSYTVTHFQKDSSIISTISSQPLKIRLVKMKSMTANLSPMMFGSRCVYSFSSFTNPLREESEEKNKAQAQTPSLVEASQSLIKKIIEVSEIRQERIDKLIKQKVEKELQRFVKQMRNDVMSEEEQILQIVQQKLRIQSSFAQNQEFMRVIQLNENHRAMIMIRLATLWNENYEEMSINELIYLINELEDCKQLRNNELKSMTVIFLTVQTLKKCLLSPRVNKNMICETKSLWENATHVKKCFKGEMEARSNLQKVESLLTYLINSIENNSNRYCFMKVQQQIHFLVGQIFKSFHESDLYSDKGVCLLSNPPRVVFDEPFHQEYDRFLEMSVLILFDKKLKKEGKLSKLENVTHIFEQVKTYEEVKLTQCYEKKSSVLQIKKLKKKVNRMDKRVNLIKWVHNFMSESASK